MSTATIIDVCIPRAAEGQMVQSGRAYCRTDRGFEVRKASRDQSTGPAWKLGARLSRHTTERAALTAAAY